MKTVAATVTSSPALARGEVIVIALLILAGIGGGVVARRDLSASRTEAAEDMRKRSAALEQARAEGARLERESEALLTRATGTLSGSSTSSPLPTPAGNNAAVGTPGPGVMPPVARLTALGHLADLVQKGVLSTRAMPMGAALGLSGLPAQMLPAYMIDGQGKLAPGFGELFGLSEAETIRFQAAVSDLKRRSDEFVVSHTVARAIENGYVLEYVPADGMAEIRDAGVATLRSILGDERYRIFVVLNGERTGDNGTTTGGPMALFDAAGNSQRTLTLTRTATGASYTMTSGPNGARIGSGSLNGGDAAMLFNRFGPAARLIPQDFIDSLPRGPAGAGGGGGGSAAAGRGAAPEATFTKVPEGDTPRVGSRENR